MSHRVKPPALDRPARLIGYFGLIGVAVLASWVIAVRLRAALLAAQASQHLPWGLWSALHTLLVGVSVAAFLTHWTVQLVRARRFEAVAPLALAQASGAFVLGLGFLVADLGHPARLLEAWMLWNPRSVLAWELALYVLYALALAVAIAVSVAGARAGPEQSSRLALQRRRVATAGAPIAFGVLGGTGAIFAALPSKPVWYASVLAVVFVLSSLAVGEGVLGVVAGLASAVPARQRREIAAVLIRSAVLVMGVAVLLLVPPTIVLVRAGGSPHVAAWAQVMFGPDWWVFWLGEIGLGAALPAVLVTARATSRSGMWLASAGVLVALGALGIRLNLRTPGGLDASLREPSLAVAQSFARTLVPPGYDYLTALGALSLVAWAIVALRARRAHEL